MGELYPRVVSIPRALSLPHYLRNSVRDFPDHQGYLKADPERVAYSRQQLPALGDGLKIGISWRGGTVFTHREWRTSSLDALHPVITVPGVRWVNLQYGTRATEIADFERAHGVPIVDWPAAIDGDYDETAALVSALDLVISVCTSVVHLTGALGTGMGYGGLHSGMAIRTVRRNHALVSDSAFVPAG